MKLDHIVGSEWKIDGFVIRQNGSPKNIRTLTDVYELYNTHQMCKDVKILCEAVMVYGFTRRAVDFYDGYMNSKVGRFGYQEVTKKEQNWGKKTFVRAAQNNHAYMSNKEKFDPYKALAV